MSDQHLIGTEQDDTLVGAEGNDWLEGLAGNDTLIGNEGNDILDGGTGQDFMFGGAGDDFYVVDYAGDTVIENAGEGLDTVESSADFYVLAADIENLTLVGAAASGTGNDSANIITGNDADNFLGGRLGDDILIGGAGNDYVVDDGDGNDLLDGGAGSDFLIGLDGNDVYLSGFGGQDTVYDSSGDDEVRLQGVSPDQIERIREGDHLILRVAGTADQVTLYNWFLNPSFQIERAVFDDGTVWDAATTGSLRLLGTPGDDFLFGSQYDETFEGRGGNDFFDGGFGGNDVYVLGGVSLGFDAVSDSLGDDEVRLPAGVSPDQVERLRFNDNLLLRVVDTGEQLMLLNWFLDPSFQIERVVFDDGTVWDAATTGSLRLLGTPGDDFLFGSQYDETFEGRGGNDFFDGGFGGNDVYVLGGVSLGFDAVSDSLGDDEVRLPAGVSPDQVERLRFNDNLLLRVVDTGEQLMLLNWFLDPSFQIERVVFDDGTVWDAATTGSLRLLGTPGDDFLFGSQYDETFEGRGGNDFFDGGFGGNDVYVLGGVSLGFDAVSDSLGDDEVRLPAGVSPDQVERLRFNDNLLLRVVDTGEQLMLLNWFLDPSFQIERVVFDDGTVWDAATTGSLRLLGTPGDDFLFGSQYDETFEGRGGNDFFDGGFGGNDVYVLGGVSLGFDAVSDSLGDDEVRLPAGVSPDQVERLRFNDNLLLRVVDTGEQLMLLNWFLDPSFQIERVVFDDGTVWDAATTGSLRLLGTADDDFLVGTEWGERIEGRGGHDFLFGNAGNDTLDGGTGNDFLLGASGDDVYLPGSGMDSVFDFEGTDELRMAAGIAPDQVERIRFDGSDDLHLRVAGSFDEVRIANWFTSVDNQVERVVFEDGTVWDAATSGSLRLLGTADDDFLVGTEWGERIEGRGGHDFLLGNGGDDVLVGGEGSDFLDGGAGADTYVFFAADGTDLARVGAGDRVQLPGLSRSSVLMTRDEFNLYITVMDTGAALTLLSGSGLPGEEGWRITLEFGDGSVWLPENVVNTSPYIGTGGDDVLNGSEFGDQIFAFWGNDLVHGNDGNDVLYGDLGFDTLMGGQGNDVLDGGAGNDGLQGGVGNDTYILARGTGFDYAWELLGTAADFDVVSVAADITPSEIAVQFIPPSPIFVPPFNNGGFILSINGTADALVLLSPTMGPEMEIEQVIFADGTIWDEAILAAMAIQNGQAPIVVNPLADQSASEDAPFAYVVPADAFFEQESLIGDSLSYGASLADGSSLPSWLAFDANTRNFSGTPANGDVGTVSVRVTATDESGRSASDVFDLAVTNTNDAPTLENAIADQSARDTLAFSFTVPAATFADVDLGDTLTYSATLAGGGALPAWLTFNPGTRAFSGTPGPTDIGGINVEVRATDNAGASATDVFAILVGPAPDQTITGTSGNDTLSGASGNDTIDGLGGADSMSGGLGNDTYFVGNSGDQVIESANAGIDTVISSITHTLGANVENLTLTGSANRNGTGNALDNVITGNSGSNTLNGGAGNDYLDGGTGSDSLIGGLGDDTFVVNSGNDSVNEQSGAGNDTVRSSISHTLGTNVENLILTGTSTINGTGNALANVMYGNSANNTLTAGGGSDLANGGAGNDTLRGDAGNDVLEGMDGNDALSDTGGNNYLNGFAGTDTLTGGSGKELLIGGAGNDTLATGSGADIIAFNRGDGQDSINASTVQDNTLSLGGGISYADLFFRRVANDLILETDDSEQVSLKDWYTGSGNHSVQKLQAFTEAMGNYNPSSEDLLLNKKVQQFDFQALVSAFDQAKAADPGLDRWALMNKLLDAHLATSSDTEALGGDLAYQYGVNGSLAGIGLTPAQDVLNAPQFGTGTQTLRPLSSLQDGLVRLS